MKNASSYTEKSQRGKGRGKGGRKERKGQEEGRDGGKEEGTVGEGHFKKIRFINMNYQESLSLQTVESI